MSDHIDSYWGITAEHFSDAIRDNAEATSIHLRIQSPGGSVFEGRAIQNILLGFDGDVKCTVMGVCASAATLPLMAASEIVMGVGSKIMIHNVQTYAYGDGAELRAVADLVDAFTDDIAQDYAEFTGKTVKAIKEWMDNETWFTAKEAVQHGFADSVMEGRKRKNANDDGENKAKVENKTETKPKAPVIDLEAERKKSLEFAAKALAKAAEMEANEG